MTSWVDRVTAPIAPRWTARRVRARIAINLLQAHYEAAAPGRRTSGWRRSSADANAAQGGSLATLRNDARDLVRNNSYAESALATIVDHVCSWGISATTTHARAGELWKQWAESTACDADGRQDFYGLEKTVMRTVVESGECLVRRRWRLPTDTDSTGKPLPIPLQLQVLEPDFLDTTKDGIATPSGGWITQGIEYDAIGRRVAYHLFREHPGSNRPGAQASDRIPASEILHVFRPGRPGAVRGASWFAPITLRLKDFDEYLDAALMKQKIAACLAVITSDIDGTAPALGQASVNPSGGPELDRLEPGGIHNVAAGRSVTVVDPPAISEHAAYSQTVLREIATGIGVAYEDLTGDYTNLPFSAARMSRLRHWSRVHGWRWGLIIPQFCAPVWRWAMTAAAVNGLQITETPLVEWTAPPPPMLDPGAEGLAYQRMLRIGGMTWAEMIRELGYDPDKHMAEIKKWNEFFDKFGVIFDGDPRKTTQGGQLQGAAAGAAPTSLAAALSRDIEEIVRRIFAETATNGAHR